MVVVYKVFTPLTSIVGGRERTFPADDYVVVEGRENPDLTASVAAILAWCFTRGKRGSTATLTATLGGFSQFC